MDIQIIVFGAPIAGSLAGFFYLLNDMRKSVRDVNGHLNVVVNTNDKISKVNDQLVDLTKGTLKLVEEGQRLTIEGQRINRNYESLVGRSIGEDEKQTELLRHVNETLGALHRRFDDALKK